MKNEFMREAIRMADESVQKGGSPFGSVIVKNGKIIAKGYNTVHRDNDPTAHAEVVNIREACRELNTTDLSGCEIYASCEPCPMCLAAILWAGIDKVYYANTKEDAAEIGFDDSFIYEQIALKPQQRVVPTIPFLREEALKSFLLWKEKLE